MQIDPCTSVWTRNREGEFVPLWFNGQQFPDELMKPAKQKAPVTQNPVCNEEKPCPPPRPPPPPPPLPLTTTTISIVPTTIFSTCWKYTLKAGIKSDDDCFADNKGEEMNLTPTLLIKIVTAVTVTMKCTPEYPKHRALNSLHDMAYYK